MNILGFSRRLNFNFVFSAAVFCKIYFYIEVFIEGILEKTDEIHTGNIVSQMVESIKTQLFVDFRV